MLKGINGSSIMIKIIFVRLKIHGKYHLMLGKKMASFFRITPFCVEKSSLRPTLSGSDIVNAVASAMMRSFFFSLCRRLHIVI